MSLSYLLTKLPSLKMKSSANISKNDFLKLVINNLPEKNLVNLRQIFIREALDHHIYLSNNYHCDKKEPTTTKLQKYIYKNTPKKCHHLLPQWVFQPQEQHILLRYWYRSLYSQENSSFLSSWVKDCVNLEELLCGLLSSAKNLSKKEFSQQLLGHFDSCAYMMNKNFSQEKLGLGERFNYFTKVSTAIQNEDFTAMQEEINKLHWRLIEENTPSFSFSFDLLYSYYLKLRIISQQQSWDKKQGDAILNEILHFDLQEI